MAKLWSQKFRRVSPHCCRAKAVSHEFLVSKDPFQTYSHATLTFPMAEIHLVTLTCLYLAAISSTHVILLLSSVPPEIKDGHHPTSPSDLDTLHRDLWAMEQLCHRELPSLTLGHWDSWQGDKTRGLPLHLPQTDTSQSAALSQPSHAVSSLQQELGPTSPTRAGWGQGTGVQWLPCVTTWPVQHKAAMAAQTQLHRLHHSHCPKVQAPTVEFLLSIPIGKCQIMFQYKSVMCDSTA